MILLHQHPPILFCSIPCGLRLSAAWNYGAVKKALRESGGREMVASDWWKEIPPWSCRDKSSIFFPKWQTVNGCYVLGCSTTYVPYRQKIAVVARLRSADSQLHFLLDWWDNSLISIVRLMFQKIWLCRVLVVILCKKIIPWPCRVLVVILFKKTNLGVWWLWFNKSSVHGWAI
jgi:hypothetical protein